MSWIRHFWWNGPMVEGKPFCLWSKKKPKQRVFNIPFSPLLFGSGGIDGNGPCGSRCDFLRTGDHRTYLRLGSNSCAYLEFRYLMCELKGLSSVRYYDSDNIVARLNLPNMAYPTEDRLEMYLARKPLGHA